MNRYLAAYAGSLIVIVCLDGYKKDKAPPRPNPTLPGG